MSFPAQGRQDLRVGGGALVWRGVVGYITTKQYKTFQFYIVTKLKPKICIKLGVIKTVISYYITPITF
jgi:hypothetical protein